MNTARSDKTYLTDHKRQHLRDCVFLAIGALTVYVGMQYHLRQGATPWQPTVKVDQVTGCEYIVSGLTGTVAPRAGRDGKQICGQ